MDSTGNKKPHLAFLDLDIDQLHGQVPSPFTTGLGGGASSSSAAYAGLNAHSHAGATVGEALSGGVANGTAASSPEPSGSHHGHDYGRPRQRPGASQSRKRRRVDHNGDDGDLADGDDDDDDNDDDKDNDNRGAGGRDGEPGRRGRITNRSAHGRTQYLYLDDPPYHHRRRNRRGGDDDNGHADDNDDDASDDDSNASSSSLDHTWIPPLPALPLLKAIVEAHFQTVHHWVPILHPTRFRAALNDPRERRRRAVLIHAIIAMSIKYVDFGTFGLTSRQVTRQIRLSRRAVQLNALDGLSFVNTQALIFLAFDYVRLFFSPRYAREPPCLAALEMLTFLTFRWAAASSPRRGPLWPP